MESMLAEIDYLRFDNGNVLWYYICRNHIKNADSI